MTSDNGRPDWSDVTAWEDREKAAAAKRAELNRLDLDRDRLYPANKKWDSTDVVTVLDFEAEQHPRRKKEELIRTHFKVSPARYYQRLLHILRQPEAVEHNPQVVRLINDRIASNQRINPRENS